MATDREPTVASGYPLGRPENRPSHALDSIIRRAIEKMPMETRLYPDVYAWSVADAVVAAISKAADKKLLDADWAPLSDENIAEILNDNDLGMIPDRLRELSRQSARAIIP